MRLLSVDWDYFLPTPNRDPKLWSLYDWGHRDGGHFFLNGMWQIRAVAFERFGVPRPTLIPEVETFWSRFRFRKNTKLLYADSHSYIIRMLSFGQQISNYDAHHDGGYGRKFNGTHVTCEEWARYAVEQTCASVMTYYPRWKMTVKCRKEGPPACDGVRRRIDPGKAIATPFDAVFVCRSGGWMPSWLDGEFEAFLDRSGLPREALQPCEPRQWDESVISRAVQSENQAFGILGFD